MRVRSIPLHRLAAGMFLMFNDDELHQDRLAAHVFCEPAEVIGVHRGSEPDERLFIRNGGIIVRAAGCDGRGDRWIILEMARRDGGSVLVPFPDDRHLVSAVSVDARRTRETPGGT